MMIDFRFSLNVELLALALPFMKGGGEMVNISPNIRAEIKRQGGLVTSKIVDIRRDLHCHPERSKRGKRTSDLIASYLAG